MTTWVSRHQKGKTYLDFNETSTGGLAVASAGAYAPCSRQITMPEHHYSVSYRPDAVPDAQSTVSKL